MLPRGIAFDSTLFLKYEVLYRKSKEGLLLNKCWFGGPLLCSRDESTYSLLL
jgi:hypothetical protein